MKLEDFWERVEKTPDCWVWHGSRTSAGYGNLNLGNASYDYAHRVAYRLTKGVIPEGMHLDHLCRNRACVNPGHLEPVTPLENVRRGAAAYGPLKDACIHGHDMTDTENVYRTPKGHHRCRTCSAEANARRAAARRARGDRRLVLKSECIRGHAFDHANTYITPSGQRSCRQCSAFHARKYRAERKSS